MIYVGTGHRPQFLPCKFNEESYWLKRCLLDLEYFIEENGHQIDFIISGGAIGWDTWLAETSYKLSVPYKVYVPFKSQDRRWPHASQERYLLLLKRAEEVKYICKGFSKRSFLIRDQKMVDDGDQILALWNPGHKNGGTYHTVCYAESKHKEIVNFWRD